MRSAQAVDSMFAEEGLEERVETAPQLQGLSVDAITGGYSAEAHRATLETIKKEREKRLGTPQSEVEDDLTELHKRILEILGSKPGKFTTMVYDTLKPFGYDGYEHANLKKLNQLQEEGNCIGTRTLERITL